MAMVLTGPALGTSVLLYQMIYRCSDIHPHTFWKVCSWVKSVKTLSGALHPSIMTLKFISLAPLAIALDLHWPRHGISWSPDRRLGAGVTGARRWPRSHYNLFLMKQNGSCPAYLLFDKGHSFSKRRRLVFSFSASTSTLSLPFHIVFSPFSLLRTIDTIRRPHWIHLPVVTYISLGVWWYHTTQLEARD